MTTLTLADEPTAAIDTDSTRDVPATPRPAPPGGLTLPVLAFAALVASPAIWQCLVRHGLAMHVMLERYVAIAVGCLLVSEAVRRLLPRSGADLDRAADVPTRAAGGTTGEDEPATAD